jgi:hypothetical protein
MSRRHPLIIHYKTSQLLCFIVGVVFLLASVLSAGFFYGDKTYSDDQEYIDELQATLDQFSEKVTVSQQALVAMQLTAQVDAAALEQTRLQLLDMQKQVYRRDQELKLYREMLQDSSQSSGLSVSDLRIEKVVERLYQYHWVVQQKTHEAKKLQVNAKIWIIGTQDGKEKILPLNEIDAEIDDLPIQLKLKYFSINRGLVELPQGFTPEFLRVSLRYPWIEKPQFDKKFVWQVKE